jgi:hypothetical protein
MVNHRHLVCGDREKIPTLSGNRTPVVHSVTSHFTEWDIPVYINTESHLNVTGVERLILMQVDKATPHFSPPFPVVC